jgi:hypothetical protein
VDLVLLTHQIDDRASGFFDLGVIRIGHGEPLRKRGRALRKAHSDANGCNASLEIGLPAFRRRVPAASA